MLRSRLYVDPTPAIAAHVIVSSSDRRFSLTFFPPSTGFYVISPEQNVTLTTGLVMSAGQAPIVLNLVEHGDVVQLEWSAISSVVGAVPSWIDALL